MKGPPVDVCETFWLKLNPVSQSAILRQLDLAPDGGYALSFQQRRQGLVAAALDNKITKLRDALKAAGGGGERRGPGRPAKPAVSLDLQRDAVALCGAAGFLFQYEGDTRWLPAAPVPEEADQCADAIVQAAIKSGWLQKFYCAGGAEEFHFVAVAAAGWAALEQSS